MSMFTLSVFINRSQQDVFDLLSNPENRLQGMPGMQSGAWIPNGEAGGSSIGKGTMKLAGQEMELLLEVTRWDPPKCYGIKIRNVQLPFETTEYVYRLEPEDGGTRVTLESEVEWVISH